MEQQGKNKRKFIGVVVSDKMDKTAVIERAITKMHPKVRRYVRRTKRFMAHNPNNDAKIGDTVVFQETRPLSRNKRWEIVEIKKRAGRVLEIDAGEAAV